MIRISTVKKAFRNTLLMLNDPEAFGKRIALEAKKISKAQLPFVRLLGSGDLTTDEQVVAFNTLAQNSDRPIQIFSRHHDMLAKLEGTPAAPFLKMGSIDAQLAKVYGMDFLKKNLSERGIVNAFLYTDPSEQSIIQELQEADALHLILSANHNLHEGLPLEQQMSSCPCDAGERSYMASCRQCALGDMGCFMSFSVLGIDSKGKLWSILDTKAPDELNPIAIFANSPKRQRKGICICSFFDVLKKSVDLVNLYIREFEKGNRDTIPLKDIRFNGEDSVSYVKDPLRSQRIMLLL